MATPALYRRYRPESFAEVIGQDHVTEPLRRALRSQRVGHAYLFSGPRGCGKTTSARILARCLNCAEGPTDTPCGVCDSCRDLARGGAGSLDVVEIDAASHGGVDDARELRERATFAPVRDRYKVFIIDEAHMVTSAGFNALLKLVEEPPEHVKFIFATTEPDKVIGTIRSRTHHYPFRLIPPQILLPYVEELSRQEGVHVAEGVLSLVVRAGGGSARDTLSVLDQLMAGSDENGVDLELAANLLGFTDVELLNRSVAAIAGRDAQALFTAIDEVIGSGHEPRGFVEDLLERFRDLIVLMAAPQSAAELLPDVPVDQLEELMREAQQFQPRGLTVCAEIIAATLDSMTGATAPRLHLELLAAKIMLRDEPSSHAAPGVQPAEMPSGGSAGAVGVGHGGQAGGGQFAGAGVQGGPGGQGGQPGGSGQPGQGSGSARERAMQVARAQAEAARARRAQIDGAVPQAPPQQSAVPQQSAPQQSAPQQSAAPAPQQHAPVSQQSAAPAAQQQGPQGGAQLPPSAHTVQSGMSAHAAQSAQSAYSAQSAQSAQSAPQQSAAPAPQLSAAPQSAAPAPRQSAASVPQAGAVTAQQVEENWSALMDALQSIRRPSWALIAQNAAVHSVNGSQLVLGFRAQGLVAAFYRGTAAANMAEAVHRILRADVTVDATAGGEPPAPPTQSQLDPSTQSQAAPATQPQPGPAAWGDSAPRQSSNHAPQSAAPAPQSAAPAPQSAAPAPQSAAPAPQSATPALNASADPWGDIVVVQPPSAESAAPSEPAPVSAQPTASASAPVSAQPAASAAPAPASPPSAVSAPHASAPPSRAPGHTADSAWDDFPPDEEPPFDPYHDSFPDAPGFGGREGGAQQRGGQQRGGQHGGGQQHGGQREEPSTQADASGPSQWRAVNQQTGQVQHGGAVHTASATATESAASRAGGPASMSQAFAPSALPASAQSPQSPDDPASAAAHDVEDDQPTPATPPAMDPVVLPPQPSEDQPRTHGQGELVAAMRAAYGDAFTPSATLIAAPNQTASNDTAPNPAASGSSESAPSAPNGSSPASASSARDAAAIAGGGDARWGDSVAPQPERPMSGADLARAAARQTLAASRGRTSGPVTASGPSGSAGVYSGQPGAAPRAQSSSIDDDPYGGASRDDEDATGPATSRRAGRDIVEQVLGGEVLEVIDETRDQY